MQNKAFDVAIQKAASPEYDATFVMSATTPDRVGDTIDAKAYAPNLGKDLICLWQHQQDKPLGKWENLRVQAGKLIGDLKVANTSLGKMVKQLIADSIPLGASIGFSGSGKPNNTKGIHFTEVALLECSIVSIPAHQRAMQIVKSFGLENIVEVQSSDVDDQPASGRCSEEVLRKSRAAILAATQTHRRK